MTEMKKSKKCTQENVTKQESLNQITKHSQENITQQESLNQIKECSQENATQQESLNQIKERSPMTTLCYIEQDDSYLMLHRVSKKNDINKDKWIGIGGHFEDGESPEECLLREAYEETGLRLTSYRFRGIVTFICNDYPTEYMCLYTADGYEGNVCDEQGNMKECNEGVLCWVKKQEVCNLNLWEGDKIFFGLLEEERPFFSLKLVYEGDKLMEAVLDGEEI